MERINNYTTYRYLEYTPRRAWETFETLANYDNTYGTSAASADERYERPAPSMPLYEPPKDVDPDLKDQFHNDQVCCLTKQVKFLSKNQPCMECGSVRHNTTACPHADQVQLAETHEEAKYAGGNYSG